jgi:anti-sigma B factor antagonist
VADDLVVQTEERGDWSVLSVRGEVDLYTAPHLKDQLAALVGAGRNRLAVDLGQVEFMDSTGLGVLIGALKRCKENGGVLALVSPRESVAKVLAITGLDKVFSIHDSVDDATS